MNNNISYKRKVEKLKELINDADYILIGVGAGLSVSAELEYGEKDLEKISLNS